MNCIMDRTACINCPALPLQLLAAAHPDWRGHPMVVVDRDKPTGVIQWTNATAREFRIFPGMRYAAGLALAPKLRGGVVDGEAVDRAVGDLARRLWNFSPRVEPAPDEAGVFWADVSGMAVVYPCLAGWAQAVRNDLKEAGFRASVAVGFTRFGSYAAARSRADSIVFATPTEEQTHVNSVSMSRLPLHADLQDTLYKLGVTTIGQFLSLPDRGLCKRFGVEAEALYRLAKGTNWTPLQPLAQRDPATCTLMLDYPESDSGRLLAYLANLLRALLSELAEHHERLATLYWRFTLDNNDQEGGEVSPAVPTRDANQILGLARLNLEQLRLPSGVVEIWASATGKSITEHQADLFQEAPRRNAEAALRAFAQIRAELGHDAVVVARPGAGHLPEAQYRWENLEELPGPKPGSMGVTPLIRRIYQPALPLPPRDRREPDGWLVGGVTEGPVEEVIGPQLITGGWWRKEASRAYYYVRTRNGRWFWIYNDLKRRRWFLQGEVE